MYLVNNIWIHVFGKESISSSTIIFFPQLVLCNCASEAPPEHANVPLLFFFDLGTLRPQKCMTFPMSFFIQIQFLFRSFDLGTLGPPFFPLNGMLKPPFGMWEIVGILKDSIPIGK